MPNAKKAGIMAPGAVPERVSVDAAGNVSPPGRPRSRDTGYSLSSWSPSASHARGSGSGRYHLLVGNALEMESWGTGEYDLVLVPHYLHLLDGSSMRDVLGKARRALKPEGRRVVRRSRESCVLWAALPLSPSLRHTGTRACCVDGGGQGPSAQGLRGRGGCAFGIGVLIEERPLILRFI